MQKSWLYDILFESTKNISEMAIIFDILNLMHRKTLSFNFTPKLLSAVTQLSNINMSKPNLQQ